MTAARKPTTKKPIAQKAATRPASASKTPRKPATRTKKSSELTWAEMNKTIAGILKRNAKALEKLAQL